VVHRCQHYAGILRQSTDACFAVMAQMSRRLHWQIAELDRLTLHNATFRVVSYLLDQVPSTHLVTSEIQLDTPKHVIASRLSITPETLSRTFAKLSREGYIDIMDNMINNDIGACAITPGPVRRRSAISVSSPPMEMLYFTLAAIILYVAADWILDRIEIAAGRRLEYRNLVFFVVLFAMAITSFALIRHFGSQ
jgi:hypothetical protein